VFASLCGLRLISCRNCKTRLEGLSSVLGLGSTASECCDPKMERMENTTAVVKITETAAAGRRRTDFIMLGGGG
jgi:hypothetical protein